MKDFLNNFKNMKVNITIIIFVCLLLFSFFFFSRLNMALTELNPDTSDEIAYLSLSENLKNGKGLTLFDQGDYLSMPLYPATISAFNALSGLSPYMVASLISLFTFSASIVLSFLIFKRFSIAPVAILCAILFGLLPGNFKISIKPYTEGLFIFLSLLGIYLYIKDQSFKSFLYSSLFLALATLTRYEGVLFLSIVWIIFTFRNLNNKRLIVYSFFVFLFCLVMPFFIKSAMI